MMNRLCRVALVGAPGSGKSAVLQHLKKIHNPEHHVAFIDEVATKVLTTFPSIRPLAPAFFQSTVTTCQAQIEDAILSEWKQNSLDHGLLISDRGLFDYFCYTTPEQEKYLAAQCSFEPYDLVFYLHGRYQGTTGNAVRTETAEDVARLDMVGLDVWKRSVACQYDFFEIDYTRTIDSKARLIAETINEFFMKDFFRI